MACSATSLSFPATRLSSLPLTTIQSIEQQVHQQLASVAYSITIPKNSSISIPVVYSAKTQQTDYSNYIAFYSLNSNPCQCLSCAVLFIVSPNIQIHADINQSNQSIFNGFEMEKEEIDFGKVIIGAPSIQCVQITNNRSFPLSFSITAPSTITAYVIPAGKELVEV